MPHHDRRRNLGVGLILFASLAPAPPQQQQQQQQQPPAAAQPVAETVADRARVRSEAGAKAYDLAWLYYSENRIDADKVYRWSRRLWEADRDSATDKAGRVTAAEGHRERMMKLDAKIAKIRKLGFGNSLDVAEVDYYRREAEFWLADAQAK